MMVDGTEATNPGHSRSLSMRGSTLALPALLFPVLVGAQVSMPVSYVVLDEDFADGDNPGMSSQWLYSADQPAFVPDCSGDWAVTLPNLLDPNLIGPWMFYPISVIDPFVSYELRYTASSPFTADPFIGPEARGALCWFNPNTSTIYGTDYMWQRSPYCTESFIGNIPPPPPADPDAQYGVLLTLGYGEVMGNPADAYLQYERVRVTARQRRAYLRAFALLGGPYDPVTQRMRADLSTQVLIPLTEPFTALGYPQIGGGGGETTTPEVLAINSQANGRVVDWVRLELRAISDSSNIVAVRHGLLMQNGLLISASGEVGVLFDALYGGYYVAVRPRNHLGVMTNDHWMVPAPNGGDWLLHFDLPGMGLYGTQPARIDGEQRLIWPGNAHHDHVVKYTGITNDRDPILIAVGSSTPANTVNGQYRMEDLNMDGMVKYTGGSNDRDIILQAIGGSIPNAMRYEQLP